MFGCMACSFAAAAAAAKGRCIGMVVTAAGGGRKASANRWPPGLRRCISTEAVELVGSVEVGGGEELPLENILGTTVAVIVGVSSP